MTTEAATVAVLPVRRPRPDKPATAKPTREAREAAKAQREAAAQARRWQNMAAVAIGTVALTLTVLSLSHLAHGIAVVTHAPVWESWAMAIGIDLGFVACEIGQIVAVTPEAKGAAKRWGQPIVIGSLIASAAMNAFGFAAAITGLALVPAIALGAAIPAMIYGLTRFGIAMWR